MKSAGSKLINIFFGFIGLLIGLQLIMASVQPYLHVIGFVLASAVIGFVISGVGYVMYRAYQYHRGGGDSGM